MGATIALVGFRQQGSAHPAIGAQRPRLSEVTQFLARPPFLAYLALFARETLGLTIVAGGRRKQNLPEVGLPIHCQA